MNEIDKNYNKTFEDIKHIDENEIPKDMLNGMCIHFEVSTIDIW